MTSVGDTKPVASCYLVGIVASYIPYCDVAVSSQTGTTRVIFEETPASSKPSPLA